MFNHTPRITKNIIIINIILFIVSAFATIDLSILLGGFYPESVNFKPYQIVTHMFMHANFLHIAFNMYALFMFGGIIEQTLGEQRFFILYSLGGLGSFMLFNFMNYIELNSLKETLALRGVDMTKFQFYSKLDFHSNYENQINSNFNSWINTFSNAVNIEDAKKWFLGSVTPMVGASGAISSLMTAFAVFYPNMRLQLIFPPIALKAKYFIAILIGIDIYLGFQNNSGDNIAHFAHVGGAIVGIILGKIWKNNEFRFN